VVVALDAPYGLGSSQATLARVALFGRTDAAFDALLAVLTGRALPQGRLPVAVAGVDPGSAC
jgi:beta-N-acetylhexosaminidase